MTTIEQPPAVDRAVPQKEAARILGMAVSTLRANRHVPYVLQPSTRTGGRPRRTYLLSDLYAYLQRHRVDPQKKAS